MPEITTNIYKIGDKVECNHYGGWYAHIKEVEPYKDFFKRATGETYKGPDTFLFTVNWHDKKNRKLISSKGTLMSDHITGFYIPPPKTHPLTKQFREDFLL